MHQFWFDLCLATLSFTTQLQTAAFKHLIPTKHTAIILTFEIHNMSIRSVEPFSSPWGLWWDSSQSLTFAPPWGWKLKDNISVTLLIWYYSVFHSNVIFDILNILGQLQQISQIYHTQVRMFWVSAAVSNTTPQIKGLCFTGLFGIFCSLTIPDVLS